ncbi:MAG: hypothetical protein RMJ33_00040 [Saprospiraceae bacterium]|nr:hypothetical protein [Saprospiraceae bacterium]MDW8228198.1 hypothetical protein [Saprospiraceae bacterium]
MANLRAQTPVDVFAHYLSGEWDNFQQCWTENTETESHRVPTAHPHRHIHSVFERDTAAGLWVWRVEHYEGNRRQLLAQYTMRLRELPDGQWQTDFSPMRAEGQPVPLPTPIRWRLAENAFIGQTLDGLSSFVLKKDTFWLLDTGLFARPDQEPYRFLKCRFFRGWIQYPMEHVRPDSIYFYAGLTLHDQGDAVQLRFPDGSNGEYTVELTQLVHSRRTPIMKLAIYTEPPERLHWNSRAIAYTWADPAARRIGINIRKVVSGWTLISDP